MISSEYIHELIVHPENAGADDLSRLHELTELYPYSSTFSVLYLKALSNCKDVRLESEIEKLAYRVSSRTVLYDLLHTFQKETPVVTLQTIENPNKAVPESSVEEPKIPIEPVLEIVREEETDTIDPDEANVSQDEITETEVVELIDENTSPTEIREKIEEEIPSIETEVLEEKQMETDNVEDNTEIPAELETNISPVEIETIKPQIEPLVAHSTIDDWEEEGEVIPLAIENRNQEKIEVFTPVESAPLLEQVETPPVEKSEDEKELDKLITSSAVASGFLDSYVEKLRARVEEENALKAQKEAEKKVIEAEKIEIKEQIEEPKTVNTEIKSESTGNIRSFSSWLHASKSTASNTVQTEAKVETKIEPKTKEEREPETIETPQNQAKPTFVSTEKPKKEFFSPAKKAKESLDENRMPVSETLARIFVLQGNYPKAIHVYEQLILIIPEKKSFFATQIKILKKKINS